MGRKKIVIFEFEVYHKKVKSLVRHSYKSQRIKNLQTDFEVLHFYDKHKIKIR